jgi:hypothetical protein
MNKFVIIEQIDGLVNADYRSWHIGITSAPEKSRVGLGKPKPWRYWTANYLGEALAIRDHFVALGLLLSEDQYSSGNTIYVF